jgi:hypothetical protein
VAGEITGGAGLMSAPSGGGMGGGISAIKKQIE